MSTLTKLLLPGLLAMSEMEDSERGVGGLVSFGMSKKKSHEVSRLSKVVADLMTRNKLTQV